MKKVVYSIYDKKAEMYLGLSLAVNMNTAIRDVELLVNTEGSPVNSFPVDFDVYKIGVFDDATGLLSSDVVNVLNCADLLHKGE